MIGDLKLSREEKKVEDLKVFGYPEFDASGEKILTAYDNEYAHQLMDIRVYRMKAGEVREFEKPAEETAVLLLKGKVTYRWEDREETVSRKDVFTEGLYALHTSKGIHIKITAETDAEILVQSTHNDRDFASKFYGPQDAPWKYSAKGMFGGTAQRQVSTVFDYSTAPYSNMVLGEVLNDRGNWSGYIPHSHPQPETYFFLFDRPEGFGASFVGEDVYKIKDGSFSAIPGGRTHPQAAAPGYLMYTCWMIRHFDGDPWNSRIDDERYTWLYDAKFD